MNRDLPIGTMAAKPHLLVRHRRELTPAFKFWVNNSYHLLHYGNIILHIHCMIYIHMYHADDLLVHLGVYQRVMKLVRDELYGI